MTHWGVNLDSISMINLIMCIGFSVDFSAHISYAYISCYDEHPNEKVKTALYSLGLPIFQGSISTVLGIIALAFAPSYVFVTFFKTVFLVMLFGATHGVLLLPVLLSMTDFCRDKDKKKTNFKANIQPQNGHPFYLSEKHFNGKTILSNGQTICIPRPSFTEIHGTNIHGMGNGMGRKLDLVEATTSSSAEGGSVIAEKDLGLGTSGEEYSEGSWKDQQQNQNKIITKQSEIKFFDPKRSMSSAYETIYKDWNKYNKKQPKEYHNHGFVDDDFQVKNHEVKRTIQSGSSLIRSQRMSYPYHHHQDALRMSNEWDDIRLSKSNVNLRNKHDYKEVKVDVDQNQGQAQRRTRDSNCGQNPR